ncbi:MAG TPA: glucose-6-phosphate isomerase, partial [Streptosporangiaceae bacterium]
MTVAETGDGGPSAGASVTWQAAALTEAAGQSAAKLAADGVPQALANKDPNLWGADAAHEASIRLGWLDAPRVSRALLGTLAAMASDIREDGLDHIVLSGMGGSSLAPEVISRTRNVPLTLLDTTDPQVVARALADRLGQTLVVVSSKSGSTIETDSHRRIYEQAFAGIGLSPEEIA